MKKIMHQHKELIIIIWSLLISIMLITSIYLIPWERGWPKTPKDAGYDTSWMIGKNAIEIQEKYGEFVNAAAISEEDGMIYSATAIYDVKRWVPDWLLFIIPRKYRPGSLSLYVSFNNNGEVSHIGLVESTPQEWLL